MKLFSVHDSKAEAYLPPLTFKSAGEAIRAFESSCADKDSNLHKYPSDFTLVELGEFDEASASIATHTAPRILSNASEFVKKYATQSEISKTVQPLISDLESRN